MESPTSSVEIQTPETSKGRRQEKKPKPMTQTPTARCTRSQSAPDWSVGEMLIMVEEFIAIEGESLKALSSYQKWKIISENCANLGVVRPLNQCKRQWESMFAHYSKIRGWESQSQDNSYWDLSDEQKKEFELPAGFDKVIYGVIRDFLIAQEEKSDSETPSESDAPVKKLGKTTLAAPVKTRPKIKAQEVSRSLKGSEREAQRNPPASKIEREQEIAAKLKENCEHIDAILQGKIVKNDGGFSSLDVERGSVTQTGFRRQQGDELVKVLGGLASSQNRYNICEILFRGWFNCSPEGREKWMLNQCLLAVREDTIKDAKVLVKMNDGEWRCEVEEVAAANQLSVTLTGSAIRMLHWPTAEVLNLLNFVPERADLKEWRGFNGTWNPYDD